jgi:hypothetical protein
MTLASDLRAYKKHWEQVTIMQNQEKRSASLELRWQQLNAAYSMAKGLNLIQSEPSEAGVYQRWAKLKEKVKSKYPNL